MKHCLKILVAFTVLCGLLGMTSLASANSLEKIKAKGVMLIGTSADYPPYEFKDANDKFVGFDMELITEIAKRMGVEAKIVDMGFDALIAALKNGKVNAVIAGMQASAERDKVVDFSKVYHNISDAFLVKAGSGIVMKSPYDAAGKKIAVQTGTIQEKWVKTHLVDTGKTSADDVFSYERVDQAAMDVAAGRIDVLFIISDPAKSHAEKAGLEIALITTETVSAGQSIAIPEGETELKAAIDTAIDAIVADGTMRKLMDKYGLF
jgi:polar amino acid transport system substrate-binding protein